MIDYKDESAKKAQKIHEEMLEKPARKIKLPKIIAVIDQAGCTGCEACIQFCPVDCIEVVPGSKFVEQGQVVEIDLDRCIGCKLCVKYCPWDTIEMVPAEESYQIANEWTLKTVVKLPRTGQEILWGAEEPEAAAVETGETAAVAAPATDVDPAAAAVPETPADEPPQT